MFSAQDPAVPETTPASPSVAKWPFILGDLVLLAAALGLWATQAPLSPLQTLLTLGALGLGAILFVMPFVMEFMTGVQLRALELEQARAEDFQRLSALDAETRKQARTAIEAQEHAARATAALENLARKFDARLAPLEAVQKSLEASATGFQDAFAIQSTMEHDDLERRNGQLEKLSVTAIAAAVKKLDSLADQPTLGPEPATLASLEFIHERLEIISHLLAQFRLPEPEQGSPSAKGKTPEEGGSMLAKALSSAQPTGDSPAVTRIIESRPRRGRKPKPASDGENAPPPPTSSSEAADTASTSDTGDNPTAESASTMAVADIPAPEESLAENASAPTEEEDTASAKVEALRADEPDSATPTPPAQAELLETVVPPRRRRSTKTEAAATLVARVLIGIGNKPYVRGDGPGLSHEKGVPMEFVEIGQWRWVAPASVTDAISVRILKNDEIPAIGGAVTLQPGQILEVNPEFPA
ncbi:MAG: hypothetical protein ABSH19_05585 [Opitutales bacterium]|jgi:hypothetical protein